MRLIYHRLLVNDIMQIGPKIMPVPYDMQNWHFKIFHHPGMQRLTTPSTLKFDIIKEHGKLLLKFLNNNKFITLYYIIAYTAPAPYSGSSYPYDSAIQNRPFSQSLGSSLFGSPQSFIPAGQQPFGQAFQPVRT